MTTSTLTLSQELDQMHDSYIEAVNMAVAAGDPALADELSRSYDEEATKLVAVRDGRTDLLPLSQRRRKGVVRARRAGWFRRAS